MFNTSQRPFRTPKPPIYMMHNEAHEHTSPKILHITILHVTFTQFHLHPNLAYLQIKTQHKNPSYKRIYKHRNPHTMSKIKKIINKL